jgi:glyoxylase-like metal-dependent hydrolase (beta-lactamase superfamily II)
VYVFIPEEQEEQAGMEKGGKKSLVLIDTGMPRSEKKIFDYIKSIGFDSKDISLIILTHPDIDHSGGLFAIKQSVAPGAQVAIHEADAPRLAGEKKLKEVKGRGMGLMLGIMGTFVRFHPVKPDILLKDGVEIASLKVIHTPSHMEGSICLHFSKDRALFVGDTLKTDSQGSLEYMSSSISQDYAQLRNSVKAKLLAIDCDVILPGHGQPISKDGSEKIRKLVEGQAWWTESVGGGGLEITV